MRVGVVVNVAVEVLEHLPVQQMRDAGVWALFVRCYEGELRWRSPAVADFVHRARESRLRVFAVPAGYGCVLAPAQHPSSLFLQVHPDTRQVDSRGRRVPYACPNNPAYLEWVTSALRTLAWLIDADGFVWEEPGFFYSRGLWGCRCRWCQELYYGRGSGPMPSELEPQVAAFRQHSIASFVSALATAVRSVDSSLASLVAPTPAPQTGAVPTGNENWRLLATVEGVDGLILTWPPVASPTAPLSGAPNLYKSAQRWLPPTAPVLLRLCCPSNLLDVEITLQNLAKLDVPGVVLEYSGRLLEDVRLSVAGRRLLAVVERVAT